MACSFILVFSSSTITKSGEKTSAYSPYFKRVLVGALSCYSTVSRGAREECIASSKASRVAICTTNISKVLFKAALANLCLLINSTCFIVGKASAVLYVLQVRFPVLNYIFVLLRDRKSIPRTTSILVSASKKVSSKNRILPNSSWIENPVIVMPYIFNVKPSIFYSPTFAG